MGNKTSISADTRKQRDVMRSNKIKQNVARMDAHAHQWLNERDHVAITIPESMDQFKMISTARDQIRRGDRPFTKADLTAILIRLQPHLHPDHAYKIYQNLTSSDLIILIREIIYLSPIADSSAPPQISYGKMGLLEV